MPLPKPHLLARSRTTLDLTQQGLADLLGSSLRTVQRWEADGAPVYPDTMRKLADAVRPRDPELASQIEEWAPRPAPPPAPRAAPPPPPPPAAPPPPPLPPPLPASVLLDSVVCAAAEAMSMAPQALRPALLAAFVRAKEAGMTVEGVIAGLAPPAAASKAKR